MSHTPKPRGLRALYDWMMRNASGRNARAGLAACAFAEASFFPIPPDLMLVPMVLADRRNAFWLACWCTFWSVLGGMLGYAIGALLYDTLGQWLISAYGMAKGLDDFQAWYDKYGMWVILIKGASPLPYKLVTIASGFAHYNLALFIGLSVITRGARFGLVAGLLYWKGETARRFIEKYLEWVLLGFLTVVVLGVLAVKYLF